MTHILADGRWRGTHGIGRFASEILDRLEGIEELRQGMRKLHALDPLWVSMQIRKRHPEVYFSPGFNAPLFSGVPLVFTVHDLIHLHESDETSVAKRLYYDLVVRRGARRASRVLTGSHSTRDEILAWAGLPEDRVTVVDHGVSSAFTADGDPFEPGYPYLLYVGNSKPHKNVDGLMRGLARAGNRIDVDLVLVGVEERAVQSWAIEFGLQERIHTLMILTDEQLASVYRGALALVLPSRHEGFGLPVLEAMSCGTPVVASQRTAVPEAAGGAARMVDAEDVEALSEALIEVCESTDLRLRLRTQGLQRVVGRTWEHAAQQVTRVLQESVREGAGRRA